ncbi:MAG: AI-2E family transporter [Rhodobacteraceae bacterium]|nr:AI-2E family transporter [Paracoccaceae bacterium]
MNKSKDAQTIDLAIRLLFLGLFLYSILVMLAPLAGVVIWATILAIAVYPLFDWLQKKLGGRKKLATTLLVLLGLLVTLGPVASAVSGAANFGSEVAEKAASGELEVPPVPEGLEEVPVIGPKAVDVWRMFETNLQGAMDKYGKQILDVASAIFGKVLSVGVGLLAMALAVIIMGILFGPGPNLVKGIQKFANRVFAPRGGEIVLMAGATIRNVSRGVVGVAAMQAGAAWVILALFGFEAAATIAMIALILAIIQIGAAIVLIPTAIYAWSSMDTGAALLFTVLIVPVAISDNFLRPIFIAQGLKTPMLVILLGVLGGMLAYGLVGIFMGPVIMAVFYELFVLWMEDSPADDAESGVDTGAEQSS